MGQNDTDMSPAIMPINNVPQGSQSEGEHRKGRRRSLKRSTTLSAAQQAHLGTVVEDLNLVERFFNGCFSSLIWRGRYVWLLLGLVMAIAGSTVGFIFFKPLKGEPQIFRPELNLGGLSRYKMDKFPTQDDSVLA